MFCFFADPHSCPSSLFAVMPDLIRHPCPFVFRNASHGRQCQTRELIRAWFALLISGLGVPVLMKA